MSRGIKELGAAVRCDFDVRYDFDVVESGYDTPEATALAIRWMTAKRELAAAAAAIEAAATKAAAQSPAEQVARLRCERTNGVTK